MQRGAEQDTVTRLFDRSQAISGPLSICQTIRVPSSMNSTALKRRREGDAESTMLRMCDMDSGD